MKKIGYLVSTTLVLAMLPALAARTKPAGKPLVGTWMLVSADNIFPDGRRVHVYGADPQGILIFDGAGHYSLHIYRKDRPKFAANDKAKGTPAENLAAVAGSNTHFGRYVVNADSSITFRIDHAIFPNWEGTEQKRSFRLVDGRLTYIVPTPTTGGAAALGEVVWQRAK